MAAILYRQFPCGGRRPCPFRRDAAPGEFPARRYEELADTAADTAERKVSSFGRWFGCHEGEPGTGEDLACAGWLAVCGPEHIGVRLAVLKGELPPRAVYPDRGRWPELYGSYAQMAAANGAER